MKSNNVALVMFVCLLALVFLPAQIEASFTVVAGKDATADGSVLFGHNDEESKTTTTWLHIAPKVNHAPGELIELDNVNRIPQVEGETWACIWFEMPGIEFSDQYMNEWGVTIASNMCGSKLNYFGSFDMVGDGIGPLLRKIIAERARTAREGVLLLGKFVEEIGYNFPGRTYIIADPNEAWVCAVTGERIWVAQRVPDDEVAVLPNRFNIRQVDLNDTTNFLACPDLISYAASHGWYNPRSGEPFDFGEVYGLPTFQSNESFNILRQQMALRLLTGKNYSEDNIPFSVKPNRKLQIAN